MTASSVGMKNKGRIRNDWNSGIRVGTIRGARAMQFLDHKNIRNTLVYVHLAEELFKGEQEYVSKVAKNTADTCALVEAGFEYVCDFNLAKIFRKRK
jgi:hypothetical protein